MRIFKRHFGLGLAAICFSLAGQSSDLQPQLSPCGRSLAFLSESPSPEHKFFWENLVPAAPTSWRVRFARLWPELDALREQIPNFRSYFLGGIRQTESVGSLLERQRLDQNRLAEILHQSLQTFVDEEVRKLSPNGSTNVKGIVSEEIAQVLHLAGQLHQFIRYLELHNRQEAAAKGLDWTAFREKRWQKFLSAQAASTADPVTTLAYWGNSTEYFWNVLSVAATRPQLQSLHRPLVLSPALFGRRPRDLEPTLNSRPPAEWKTPVQMIWLEEGTRADRPEDRKWAWGTVVSHREILTTDEKFQADWDSLAFNIGRLRESGRRLNLNVRHYLFLPTGLTRAAFLRLADLGYDETVGVVVDAPELSGPVR